MRYLIFLFLLFGCVSQPVAEENTTEPVQNMAPEPEEPPEEIPLEGTSVLELNQSSFDTINASKLKDIGFSGKSSTLALDLFLPENEDNPPIIIYVHGGGWITGSKEECPAGLLLHEGFAVACVNYRLSDEMKFPAQIEDVKAAIAFLREHSGEYGFNGNRMGIWGVSAGGHLAALAGTSGDSHEVDQGNVSTRVQAVVDYFGPVDFTLANNTGDVIRYGMDKEYYVLNESRAIAHLIGGSVEDNPGLVRQASPIAYASWDDPPFLIMHGDADEVVSVENSRRLYRALKNKSVSVEYFEIPGAGHGFDLLDGNGNPTVEWNATVSFLKYKLKKSICPKCTAP